MCSPACDIELRDGNASLVESVDAFTEGAAQATILQLL